LAYQQATELTKVNEEEKHEGSEKNSAWYEVRNKIFYPPSPLEWFFSADQPVKYRGSSVPVDSYGHVTDTAKVKRAKVKRRKAHDYVRSIVKRHPFPTKDNTI
jgi:hypothetical protein